MQTTVSWVEKTEPPFCRQKNIIIIQRSSPPRGQPGGPVVQMMWRDSAWALCEQLDAAHQDHVLLHGGKDHSLPQGPTSDTRAMFTVGLVVGCQDLKVEDRNNDKLTSETTTRRCKSEGAMTV